MKKNIIRLTLAVMMLLNVAGLALAQTTPKADKDTVNADKAAKPVFYQAAEEETSSKGGGSKVIYLCCRNCLSRRRRLPPPQEEKIICLRS